MYCKDWSDIQSIDVRDLFIYLFSVIFLIFKIYLFGSQKVYLLALRDVSPLSDCDLSRNDIPLWASDIQILTRKLKQILTCNFQCRPQQTLLVTPVLRTLNHQVIQILTLKSKKSFRYKFTVKQLEPKILCHVMKIYVIF